MSRRLAREGAYKLIFEYLFSKDRDGGSFDMVCCQDGMTQADKEYLSKVYFGVVDNYDEIVRLISESTTGFNPDRYFKPDLSALLLAAYEMKYMPDIPTPVSISEVLELVKRYSTEGSASFVNGVLAGVDKKLKE